MQLSTGSLVAEHGSARRMTTSSRGIDGKHRSSHLKEAPGKRISSVVVLDTITPFIK